MILYLSGPISNDMDGYKQKFDAAENYMTIWKGHVVLNPAVHPIGLKYNDYMRIDQAMIDAADGIVMLKEWQESNGAKKELEYALDRHKKVFFGIESVPFCEEEKE